MPNRMNPEVGNEMKNYFLGETLGKLIRWNRGRRFANGGTAQQMQLLASLLLESPFPQSSKPRFFVEDTQEPTETFDPVALDSTGNQEQSLLLSFLQGEPFFQTLSDIEKTQLLRAGRLIEVGMKQLGTEDKRRAYELIGFLLVIVGYKSDKHALQKAHMQARDLIYTALNDA